MELDLLDDDVVLPIVAYLFKHFEFEWAQWGDMAPKFWAPTSTSKASSMLTPRLTWKRTLRYTMFTKATSLEAPTII